MNTTVADKATEQTKTRGHKKKERTRKKLLDAAMTILAAHDVGSLTLFGLAEAAEMSNGTVYNYFDSREAVLDAVAVELASRFSETIDTLMAVTSSGAERVAAGIRMYMRRAERDVPWANALLRVVNFHEGLNSAFVSFVRADLQSGIDAGEFKISNHEVAIEMIVACGLAGIRSVIEGRAKADDHGCEMAFMVLRALGVSEAKARKASIKELLEIEEPKPEPVIVKRRGRPRKLLA